MRWFTVLVLLLLIGLFAALAHRCKDRDREVFYAIARLGDYHAPRVHEHRAIIHLGRAVDPSLLLPRYFKYREALLLPAESQGKCASCWAFAVSHMMADRVSLFTAGKRRELLSAQELVSCFMPQQFRCERGGVPELAYAYVMQYGLSRQSDFPYAQERDRRIVQCRVPPRPGLIDNLFRGDAAERFPRRVFAQSGSQRNLCSASPQRDPRVLEANIRNMKTEIFLNGPIVGTLMVYGDLYEYDAESVYTVSPGADFRGGHAIEIFGWSDDGANTEEEGFQGAYWICKNSWGKRWPKRMGDKYGWFYVRMGTDEAGIESRASACLPVYTRQMQSLQGPRSAVAYTSYDAYVNDPERSNFFTHLKRRRGQPWDLW